MSKLHPCNIVFLLIAGFVLTLSPLVDEAGADEIIIGGLTYNNVRIEGMRDGKLIVVTPSGPKGFDFFDVEGLKIDLYPDYTKGDEAINDEDWAKAADIYSGLVDKVTEDYMKVLVGAKLVASLERADRFEDAVNGYVALLKIDQGLLTKRVEPKLVPKDAEALERVKKQVEIKIKAEKDPLAKEFLSNTLKRLQGAAIDGDDEFWFSLPSIVVGSKEVARDRIQKRRKRIEDMAAARKAGSPTRFDINSAKDPLVRLEILIRVFKLSSTDNNRTREDRAAAFDRVRLLYEELLKKAPITHWKRSIWATDMVQWDYEVLLRTRYANIADFVEFGGGFGTNAEQMKLFNQIALADAMFMEKASIEIFTEYGKLLKYRDFSEFVTTGKRDTLNAYSNLNLPFYRSMALRYAALLDDEQKGLIAEDAGATFGQLLEDADGDLKRIGAKHYWDPRRSGTKDHLPPNLKAKIYGLHGRIKIARNQPDAAIALLNKAIAIKEIAPFEKLVALLAMSQALELKKDTAGALKAVEDAKKLVKDEKAGIKNPINLILVYARQRVLTGEEAVWQVMLGEPILTPSPPFRIQTDKLSGILTLQSTIEGQSVESERAVKDPHD